MLYGCQIWGPDFICTDSIKKALNNPFQSVQSAFMRFVGGASKSVRVQILLDEFSQLPIQCAWVDIFTRFWNTLADSPVDSLSHLVFRDNINLALNGCKSCWASRVITATRSLGAILPSTSQGLSSMHFETVSLAAALRHKLYSHTGPDTDPRAHGSEGVTLCTYNMWFSDYNPGNYLPHIMCTSIPAHEHVTLMRFRLGCADLAVNSGRQVSFKDKVPRSQRFCSMPDCHDCMEDELHVVFECKAYAHIRLDPKYTCLFDDVVIGDMRRFFNRNLQPTLASFISDLTRHRKATLVALKLARLMIRG